MREGGREGERDTNSQVFIGGKNTGVDACTTLMKLHNNFEKGYQAPTVGGREAGRQGGRANSCEFSTGPSSLYNNTTVFQNDHDDPP